MSRQKQMFTAACRFSCHRLVLNYFTLCEIRRDENFILETRSFLRSLRICCSGFSREIWQRGRLAVFVTR